MKKFLFLAALLIAFAAMSQAGTVNCASNQQIITNSVPLGTAGTPLMVACGGATPAVGNYISSVTLYALATWQEAASAVPPFPTRSITFNFANDTTGTPSVFPWADIVFTTPATNAGFSGGAANSGPLAQNLASILAFNVKVWVATGDQTWPDNSSFAFSYTYDETQIPAPVPEPATFAMLGGALVGLAVLARRKK